jgi:hypothetical protein
MLMSPINFPMISYGTILSTRFCTLTPVARWLTFGQLPENPVVTPNTTTQVVRPSAENKYLESVTVNPIPTTPGGA